MMLKSHILSLRFLLAAAFFFALLIRVTIRDSLHFFATFYYLTTWMVLFPVAVALALLCLRNREMEAAGLFAFLAFFMLLMWLYTGYSRHPRRVTEPGQTLMFWNAEHTKHGVAKAVAHVKNIEADTIGIAEAGRTEEAIKEWQQAFADRTVKVLGGEMLLLTKGTILETVSGDLAEMGNYHWLKLRFGETVFSILFVDIDLVRYESREPAFSALSTVMQKHQDENLIIMGDFNTPLESVFFDPFRQNFIHAFAHSGNGFAATWPVPFPVLNIDHVWVNKRCRLIESKLNKSWSDHRSIKVEFQFPPENL